MKKKYNVLVVDDAFFIRNLIKRAIGNKPSTDYPYEFEIVGEGVNGEEGLLLYKGLKPDIVTVDVNMGSLGGVNFIKKLRAFDKTAQVIVISSSLDDKLKKEIEKLGCYYIQKPFQEAYLWTKLDTIAEYLINKPNHTTKSSPVVKEVKQPVTQETKQPVTQEVKQPVTQETKQPVVKEVKQPVTQEVKQPIIQETKQQIPKETKQPVNKQPVIELDNVPQMKNTSNEIKPKQKQVNEPVKNDKKEPNKNNEFKSPQKNKPNKNKKHYLDDEIIVDVVPKELINKKNNQPNNNNNKNNNQNKNNQNNNKPKTNKQSNNKPKSAFDDFVVDDGLSINSMRNQLNKPVNQKPTPKKPIEDINKSKDIKTTPNKTINNNRPKDFNKVEVIDNVKKTKEINNKQNDKKVSLSDNTIIDNKHLPKAVVRDEQTKENKKDILLVEETSINDVKEEVQPIINYKETLIENPYEKVHKEEDLILVDDSSLDIDNDYSDLVIEDNALDIVYNQQELTLEDTILDIVDDLPIVDEYETLDIVDEDNEEDLLLILDKDDTLDIADNEENLLIVDEDDTLDIVDNEDDLLILDEDNTLDIVDEDDDLLIVDEEDTLDIVDNEDDLLILDEDNTLDIVDEDEIAVEEEQVEVVPQKRELTVEDSLLEQIDYKIEELLDTYENNTENEDNSFNQITILEDITREIEIDKKYALNQSTLNQSTFIDDKKGKQTPVDDGFNFELDNDNYNDNDDDNNANSNDDDFELDLDFDDFKDIEFNVDTGSSPEISLDKPNMYNTLDNTSKKELNIYNDNYNTINNNEDSHYIQSGGVKIAPPKDARLKEIYSAKMEKDYNIVFDDNNKVEETNEGNKNTGLFSKIFNKKKK